MAERVSGTKEWSVASVNVVLGCPHACRYCYARSRAVDYGQCPTADAWGTTYHRVRADEVKKRRAKAQGRVMFPTTHDITPEHLEPCLQVLENLLKAGNDVLVVSKPHLSCIKAACLRLSLYREWVLFRFTIGAMSDKILGYWEPGAPKFAERLAALKYAHQAGYATSVSCEPLLDAAHARELFDAVAPFVTDTVWFGSMNAIKRRAVAGTAPRAIAKIEAGQTPEAIRRVYDTLKDEPEVRWKESYKEVLGLELASEAGLDV